jgi:antitoxin (DNA-binding transcriptional repressor) of toxin-antitoxin stability system
LNNRTYFYTKLKPRDFRGEDQIKAYTFSEARENFASVLEEAERDWAVEIRRRDGAVFRLSPAPRSKSSPLEVPGVKLKVST